MRITIPVSRRANARSKAIVPISVVRIYTDRISRLDECYHLKNDDPISFYTKLKIMGELIHPANIIKHYRLVNPQIINVN